MPTLYTLGHSNRTLQAFLDILNAYQITHVVDIRTIPKSGYVPWFNKEELKLSLNKHKIQYIHLPTLGGLRRANKNSINLAWRNENFRGFADYMQTFEFFEGLKRLNTLIKKNNRVTILCAEALPWRCHRSLIADAEIARHFIVYDILSKTNSKIHTLTTFAKIDRKKRPIKVFYPK